MEYPSEYRKWPHEPDLFVFQAVVEGGEVIEVQRCTGAVSLVPGFIYHSTESGRDFFLFWAEDIGIAAQRALAFAREGV